MSGSEDENPRRARRTADGEPMVAARDTGAPRRRRGRRAPTNFEREMRTMAASVRQLAQHQAQMQGRGEKCLMPELTPTTTPRVGDRGPQPTVSASVFERLGEHGPRDRPQVSHQRREPSGSPPRNRRERRAREAEARAESDYRPYQPPQGSYQQPRHYEEDQQAQHPFPPTVPECPKKTRSYEVDDDDENLPFSEGIRNAPIPHEFRVPKITPYTGKGDPLDHVNTYKTEMSLRGATPALKCRAFHLTLSGGAKRWYNKLAAGSIHNWPELKRTFINYFSSGKPASAPVQRLHDIRQAESEPLQSYLSRFNEEMLFCERITDAEALSALKGGLDMNHPFWRDVRNKNPTTFDQLVELITEEITNENMILHRNRGGVAPNQVPRINYGKSQIRHLPQPPPRRRDYPADPHSGVHQPGPTITGWPSPHTTRREPAHSPILPPRQETLSKYCLVHRSHGHSTEECREVENLANRRETNSRTEAWEPTQDVGCSPRCTIAGHRVRTGDPSNGTEGLFNQDPPRRSSRSPVRLPRAEGTTENRFIKGPEKPPILQIDTIYGGPYIGGQSRKCPKELRERGRGEDGNKLANKQSTLRFKQGRPNFLYRGRHERGTLPPLRRVGSQGSSGKEWIREDASGQRKFCQCHILKRLRNPERDNTVGCHNGRGTLGCPYLHGILSGRQEISPIMES
ncbi:Uncharacterized protein Adt_44017 [Abeliophyllum distichum]|uniref:Retrotransposon gag domain-containing protein n=1 Tax=Abeliophyllum distichum TaxID=126358 RepID=A0ABD1PA94_9LAMI